MPRSGPGGEAATVGRPRLLLLAMYRLDDAASGPTVRISAIRDALAERVDLDVVSGTRADRAGALLRYAARGRPRGLAGIYVESSTSLPGPIDLTFMAWARTRRIPVLTYVRDAYQLFPEYYPTTSLKRRLARAAFRPAMRALRRASTTLAFPSRGLARVVLGAGPEAERAVLLPPGARLPAVDPVDPAARGVLYVGSLAHESSGGSVLLEGVRLARERGHAVELICVAPPHDRPPGPHPGWLRMVTARGPEIIGLLPEVLLTVSPRPATAYNDLAVPIKVMEYLGYARPVVVTDATETAAIVRAAECGLVVPDSAAGLADGIGAIAGATAQQIESWGAAARLAATNNSWGARAESVLRELGVAG